MLKDKIKKGYMVYDKYHNEGEVLKVCKDGVEVLWFEVMEGYPYSYEDFISYKDVFSYVTKREMNAINKAEWKYLAEQEKIYR